METFDAPEYTGIEDIQELAIRIRKTLHKFNNALFVISGQAQLLADSYPEPDVARDMEKIFQKIHKAADILKDVHRIARRYSISGREAGNDSGNDSGIEPIQSPKRILVADGDTWSLETLMRILEEEGHLVWTAPNYSALLKQIRNTFFHFIIVDAGLPDFDLDSFTIELRMLPQGMPTRLIVVGGEPLEDGNGFSWLPKPVQIESLSPLISGDAPGQISKEHEGPDTDSRR